MQLMELLAERLTITDQVYCHNISELEELEASIPERAAELRAARKARIAKVNAKKRRRLAIRFVNIMLAVFYAICLVCMILGFTDLLRIFERALTLQ